MARFHSFDGTEIVHWSSGDGPPLICVPGGPRASAYLEDLGGLSAHRTLVQYDARGTGDSAAPADVSTYAYPFLAEDVEALRQQIGVDVVDVLGHSSGSLVAQAYAAKYADRLGKLVLVAPGPQLYGRAAQDTDAILAGRAAEPWHGQVVEARARLMSLGPATSPDELLAVLEDCTPGAYGRWEPRQQKHAATQSAQFALAAWLGFNASGDVLAGIVEGLGAVSSPVLVTTGDRDAQTGVQIGDYVAGLFPNAEHVTVSGAGHYPWVDEPALFTDVVLDFLADR
jgi:proline iminopeptidase